MRPFAILVALLLILPATAQALRETQTFDALGRLRVIQRPNQDNLTLGWNPGGTLASITGRGLTETRGCQVDAPHRLAGIDITNANAQALVSLQYAYDFAAVGDAARPWLTVDRAEDGTSHVSQYSVDAQMRLTKSVEGDITRTFTWHPDGRRDSEEVVDASDANPVPRHVRHRYDTFGQLAGISKWVEGENEPDAPSISVQTDALGQVTGYSDPVNGTQRHLIWDAEGHLVAQSVTATGQPAVGVAYRYNWRDQRVARTLAGPAVPTTYLWGPDGLVRETTGAASTDYVHGAGMILAAGETRLAHDHLGSPIVSLIAGGVGSAGTFDGWGRYFSGPAPNDDNGEPPTTHVGYTGHDYDPDSDLTYAEARWYDPDIGAFLSADPVAGRLYEPGTLERFGYVTGNPLFFVDPDGRMGTEAQREESWSRDTPSSELFRGFLQANCRGNLDCAKALWQSNRKENYNFSQAQAEADRLMAVNVDVCGAPDCRILVNGYRAEPGSEGSVAGSSLSPLEAMESAENLRGAVVQATVANAASGVLGAAGAASGDSLQEAYENSTLGVLAGDVLTGALAIGAAAKLVISPRQLNVAQSGGLTLVRDASLQPVGPNSISITRETRPGDGIQAPEMAGASERGGETFVDRMSPEEAARYERYWRQDYKNLYKGSPNTRLRQQAAPGTRSITDQKLSESGELYRRETIYDLYGRKIGNNDYSDHGRPLEHGNPHHHPNPPTRPEMHGPVTPGLHPDTPR